MAKDWYKEKERFAIHFGEKLGDSLTKLLPVLHSITGCDSVSSFADIGKKTAFNHLKSNAEEFETLQSFGNSPELDVDGSH